MSPRSVRLRCRRRQPSLGPAGSTAAYFGGEVLSACAARRRAAAEPIPADQGPGERHWGPPAGEREMTLSGAAGRPPVTADSPQRRHRRRPDTATCYPALPQ